jgi:hypothetical protein
MVDAFTGAIMGLVTTVDQHPIPDAQAALGSSVSDPVRTDADGRFQFSDLPPGRHVVYVAALGYAGQARSLDVVAGEVAQLQVHLGPLSSNERFSSTEIKQGFISCGSGSGARGVGGFTQVSCGATDPKQRFLFNYTFAKNLKGVLLEMVWKPTQALSKDLVLTVEKSGCGFTCTVDDTFAEVQGCCYIRVKIPVENLTRPAGAMPASDFRTSAGSIQSRSFPAYGDAGAPTTLFTSQSFTIYVEYFYNALPPDWQSRSNVPD